MSLSIKKFNGLKPTDLTATIVVDVFTTLDQAYGRTTATCNMILELVQADSKAGERLITESAKQFGVGGEGTPAYRRHSSFKTILARQASKLKKPLSIRWTRSSDAVITDFEITDKQPKPDSEPKQPKTQPQHVAPESKPQTLKSVKDIVKTIMDGKPKRMKVSTIIIGLMSQLGKAGLVEVMTACQKQLDTETAAKPETVDTTPLLKLNSK
jgi:hypothetical protein